MRVKHLKPGFWFVSNDGGSLRMKLTGEYDKVNTNTITPKVVVFFRAVDENNNQYWLDEEREIFLCIEQSDLKIPTHKDPLDHWNKRTAELEMGSLDSFYLNEYGPLDGMRRAALTIRTRLMDEVVKTANNKDKFDATLNRLNGIICLMEGLIKVKGECP